MQQKADAVYEVLHAKTLNAKDVETIEQEYEYPDFDEIETQEETIKNTPTLEDKFRNFFKKKKNKNQEQEEIQEEVIEQEAIFENEPGKISSSKEQVKVDDKNKFQINASKVTYDDEKGNISADGDVEIISKAQNVILKADNALLDKASQTLTLKGNVKVIKTGVEMRGEYLLVDLNEQNILMDNPVMEAYSFIVNAQEGFVVENNIEMLNGTISASTDQEFPLVSRGFLRYDNMMRYSGLERIKMPSSEDPNKKQTYKINSKEIVITSYKDHNSVLLKGSDVYFNNKKLIKNSDIEIISDKKRQVVETNMPEAGNLRNFGTYIGYGFVYKLPKGHTFKFVPTLAYSDSDIGIGAIGRYRTQNGLVDGGWNTASSNLVVRGRYKISDHIGLTYGRNAYLPEGFLGRRRSGYAGQLHYTNSYKIKDLNARFNHGIYAGIFSDYEKDDQEEAFATTRFRYLADIRKNIFKYRNKEQDLLIALDASAQGGATLYGTGDTFGIVRVGPQLTTRLKRWESNIGYTMSGIHGQSPFLFDEYRYGKSTIMLNEKFHFSDKFAFGFRLFLTPKKDNIEEDFITESRFYIVFGPKDLKAALSYDFVRDVAHLDFMFLLGSDNSKINFDKLTTKDFDGGSQKRDFYKNAKPIKIEEYDEI